VLLILHVFTEKQPQFTINNLAHFSNHLDYQSTSNVLTNKTALVAS